MSSFCTAKRLTHLVDSRTKSVHCCPNSNGLIGSFVPGCGANYTGSTSCPLCSSSLKNAAEVTTRTPGGSMREGLRKRILALALCTVWGIAAPASAQITTGAVTGTSHGRAGRRGPGRDGHARQRDAGHQVWRPSSRTPKDSTSFRTSPPDTYTVQVTMNGFRTLSGRGVKVSGGDRVAGRSPGAAGRRRDRKRHRARPSPRSSRRRPASDRRRLTRLQLEDLPIATPHVPRLHHDPDRRRSPTAAIRTVSAPAAAARTTS